MIRCDRCHHLEAVHETIAYRGDKPRHCLVDDCLCKAFTMTDEATRVREIQQRNDYPTAEFVAHYRADIDWLLRRLAAIEAERDTLKALARPIWLDDNPKDKVDD